MEIELWKIIVMAIVQGATEFLPISSSGHLVIVAAFLSPGGTAEGLDIPALNIMLHGGTLCSILVFYWKRVWQLLVKDRRTLMLVLVGTIPAVVLGLPIKKFAEGSVLNNPLLAGMLLPVTGLILLAAARCKSGKAVYSELTLAKALSIGLSQAFAILPGISRSGTTISAGTCLGMAPNSAATFSFLLAIPVIGGACLLEIISTLTSGGEAATFQSDIVSSSPLWIGALVAFVVGFACLTWLVRWIELGRLHLFAWWCIPVGLAVVVWQLSLRIS